MKRLLALLLALVMLLSLTACGKDEEGTPTGGSTGASTNTTESTNDSTGGTQDSTQGTTESTTGRDTTETTEPPTTTPPTTTPPTTTSPATEASHTHSYSSNVTTAATCGKDGVKTFTCSCGDSYTEKIAATGQHSWGNWETVEDPTVTKKGKAQRKCATCSATESKELDKISLPFQDMFSGGNALAVSCLNNGGMTVEGMLNFCSYEIFHSYIYEHALTPLSEKHKITVAQQDFYFTQYAVPEDVVLSVITERFLLMEDFWYDTLRASDRYDSGTRTFRCTEPVWFTGIDATVVAYEHMGGDDYTLYLESRVVDHPNSPCSECATTDSCVLNRTRLSVIVCARPGSVPIIISYGIANSIPDSATPLN